MPYPPPVPPLGRTNATPEVDNHPSDHNTIAAALTEIINHIAALETKYDAQIPQGYGGIASGGTTPQGGQNTIATMTLGNAGWYLITYTVLLSAPGPINGSLRFFLNSGFNFDYWLKIQGPTSVNVTLLMNAPTPGSSVAVNMVNPGPGSVDAYADGSNHRLGAVRVVYP